MAPQLKAYKVNKKTVAVPNDWDVEEKILINMVKNTLSRM
jgi:hypothetical protein